VIVRSDPAAEERAGRRALADLAAESAFDHFGSGRYAREELIAQMASSLLCAHTGHGSRVSRLARSFPRSPRDTRPSAACWRPRHRYRQAPCRGRCPFGKEQTHHDSTPAPGTSRTRREADHRRGCAEPAPDPATDRPAPPGRPSRARTAYLATVIGRGAARLVGLTDGRKRALAPLAYQIGGLLAWSGLPQHEVTARLTAAGTSSACTPPTPSGSSPGPSPTAKPSRSPHHPPGRPASRCHAIVTPSPGRTQGRAGER
jgi:hypothetical protein